MRAPLSDRVASLGDQAEAGGKGQRSGDMGSWSAGPGYPGKVDRSVNDDGTKRERAGGQNGRGDSRASRSVWWHWALDQAMLHWHWHVRWRPQSCGKKNMQ